MKSLVIAPQPFFSPRGTPFSVYYRTLILSELGTEVDLLTYGEGQDVDIPGVNIIRIPHWGFMGHVKTGPSMLKLFLDLFVILWTLGLLLRNRYDFVHAHEESVFWCWALKPIFRFKLVYDMHSSLPQQLSNFNFTESKLIYRIFKWLEDSSIRAADVVITICPDLRDYVDGLGEIKGEHLLIENSIFDPVRLVEALPDKAANGEPVTVCRPPGTCLVYAGTFEHYQGINLLVEAMAEVSERVPDAKMLLLGGTPEQVAQYKEQAEHLGLSKVCIFTGRVSKDLADKFTSEADLLLSPRVEGTNTPLKIYQQLASGKPLVATAMRNWLN